MDTVLLVDVCRSLETLKKGQVRATPGVSRPGALAPPDAIEVLDLVDEDWGLVDVHGQGPAWSKGVQAHVVGDRGDVAVVDGSGPGIFNDVFILKTANDVLSWTKLSLDWRSDWTMVPGTRESHCSCANASTGVIFIFGGQETSGVVNNATLIVDVATAVGLAPNVPEEPSVWRRDS